MSKETKEDAKMAVALFDEWIERMHDNELPSAQRFKQEFMEEYGAHVDDKSPLYFMFMGFLGAVDLIRIDGFPEEEKGAKRPYVPYDYQVEGINIHSPARLMRNHKMLETMLEDSNTDFIDTVIRCALLMGYKPGKTFDEMEEKDKDNCLVAASDYILERVGKIDFDD